MLLTFELHISYTSYPDISLALLLFITSLLCFLLGCGTVHLAYAAIGGPSKQPLSYRINLTRLRRFQMALLCLTAVIFIFNWKHYGPPPLFGFFGLNTYSYGEYGSLKQLLFPAFMTLFIVAPLDSSRLRQWFYYLLGPSCALVYASRGYLLIMMLQFLVMFSLRTTFSKRKLYLIAISTFVIAISLSDVIGNGRSSYGKRCTSGIYANQTNLL